LIHNLYNINTGIHITFIHLQSGGINLIELNTGRCTFQCDILLELQTDSSQNQTPHYKGLYLGSSLFVSNSNSHDICFNDTNMFFRDVSSYPRLKRIHNLSSFFLLKWFHSHTSMHNILYNFTTLHWFFPLVWPPLHVFTWTCIIISKHVSITKLQCNC